MKKKITYKSAPKDISDAIISSRVIDDFIPAPEQLIKKEENVKVTIHLSKNSVDFFKAKAKKIGVPYQTMIKTILDKYTSHYQNDK
ncbi:MAG: BrnA antitoxin family protein [Spirochaetes bacterium]|nr:BrnA antitoxin family protein [Spirochaetota bacterium]